MSILGQLQFRRDLAANWTSANPILLDGEMGIEQDTDLFKIGDGTTPWNGLPYGGLEGSPGLASMTIVGTTTVVNPNVSPSVIDADSGNNADLRFSLPRAPQFTSIGATTIPAGQLATVDTTGTLEGDLELNFNIPRGANGWSPILANVVDGERRVLRLVDWTGGEGTKPTVPTDNYIGPTGFTNLAGAVDIRGAIGPTGPQGQSVAVSDEGSQLTSAASSINFVGGGITATNTGSAVTVTVPPNPVGANAAPPNIGAASSAGTDSGEYANENHTHGHGDQNGGTLHAVATPHTTGGAAGTGGSAGFLSAALRTNIGNLFGPGAIFNIKDYGAVADDALGAGGTNNTVAIQTAIDAAQAAGGGIVFIPAGNYSIQTGLTVRSSGIHIMGVGCGYTADVGDYRTGLVSCISWRGAADGVMLDVFPQSGASVFPLFGFRMSGLSLDGRDLQPGPTDTGATPAGIGIRMRACSGAHLQDFFLNGPFTTAALDLTTLPPGTIGGVDSHGILRCIFERFCIRQLDGAVTPGIGIRLSGSATANVNFCKFDTYQIMYRNNSARQPAIQLGNSDSNTFIMGACNSNGATNTNWGIEILGSNTSAAEVSRANIFYHCSAGTGGVFLAGTGLGRDPINNVVAGLTFTNPSTDNQFRPISTENGEPVPVFGTGATGGYGITGGSTGPRFWAEGSSLATNVANVAIANTETRVIGFAAPANFMKVGTTYRFTAGGTFTNTTAASTSTYRIRIGPTTLTGTIPAALAAVNGTTARTNIPFSVEGQVTVQTAGAAGTVTGFITLTLHNATQPVTSGAVIAPVAVNTTVINQVELTSISGAATTVATYRAANIVLINQ